MTLNTEGGDDGDTCAFDVGQKRPKTDTGTVLRCGAWLCLIFTVDLKTHVDHGLSEPTEHV